MSLDGAFDAVAFGPAKTLDLHGVASAADAVVRAEAWLRERQVSKAGTVLLITGRGSRSAGGVSVLRPAIEKLLSRLRRQGVVLRARAHGEGSLTVALAPVTALFDAPRRARGARDAPAGAAGPGEALYAGLSGETLSALRMLAERVLDDLGAHAGREPALVEAEVHRQLSVLVRALPAGEDADRALQRIAREAMESMEVE
jgi:hypothetical protein